MRDHPLVVGLDAEVVTDETRCFRLGRGPRLVDRGCCHVVRQMRRRAHRRSLSYDVPALQLGS